MKCRRHRSTAPYFPADGRHITKIGDASPVNPYCCQPWVLKMMSPSRNVVCLLLITEIRFFRDKLPGLFSAVPPPIPLIGIERQSKSHPAWQAQARDVAFRPPNPRPSASPPEESLRAARRDCDFPSYRRLFCQRSIPFASDLFQSRSRLINKSFSRSFQEVFHKVVNNLSGGSDCVIIPTPWPPISHCLAPNGQSQRALHLGKRRLATSIAAAWVMGLARRRGFHASVRAPYLANTCQFGFSTERFDSSGSEQFLFDNRRSLRFGSLTTPNRTTLLGAHRHCRRIWRPVTIPPAARIDTPSNSATASATRVQHHR